MSAIHGLQGLRHYVRSQRSRLSNSPIIFLQSSTEQPSIGKAIEHASKHMQLILAMEMGLRMVSSHPSGIHYPVLSDVNTQLELARRVGASTVVALGTGDVMDLAKATAEKSNDIEHVILVPATYAAMIASNASHSLLFDPFEEVLLPFPTEAVPKRVDSTISFLPPSLMATNLNEGPMDVLFASIAIALDGLIRGKEDGALVQDVVEKCVRLLSDLTLEEDERHKLLIEVTTWAGKAISYGLSVENRSVPMALATSLIPKHYPDYSLISFMACMLPGMCHLVAGHSDLIESIELIRPLFPRLRKASMGVGQPAALLSDVHANQALWNAFDEHDHLLEHVLQISLDSGTSGNS